MPTRDLADDLQQTTYDHPAAVITYADTLAAVGSGDGSNLDYTYLESLTIRAAPEIDVANLIYDVGDQIRLTDANVTTNAGQFDSDVALLSLYRGKWIKISIAGLVESENVTWYGIIDTIEIEGAAVGRYKIQAVGVLKLAEQVEIRTAVSVNHLNTGTITTNVGRPFNLDSDDVFGVTGNRSVGPDPIGEGLHYVFAFENRGRVKWTTQTAVDYLLRKHCPTDYQGNPLPVWELHPDTVANPPGEWYETQTDTDGKTLKSLLDELIPRKRGMSYYAYYDATTNKILLRMFTFVKERLEVSSPFAEVPKFLEANTNVIDVHLASSIWFENDCTVIESTDQQYDKVVGYGDKVTSTCTLTFDPTHDEIEPDWDEDEEDAYKDAVSTTDDELNGRYRSEDRRQNVYCRFRIADAWPGTAYGASSDQYYVDPIYDDNEDPIPELSDPTARSFPIRVRGLRLMRQTPLMDRVDYSGDKIADGSVATEQAAYVTAGANEAETIPPFVLWVDQDAGKRIYVDKLSAATTTTGATTKRNWSCHVGIASHEPSLELRVSSNRQTLLGLNHFDDPAPAGVYETSWDPTTQAGIDYEDLTATLCIEFERRLTITKQIAVPNDDRPEKILKINVRGARLDYVVPKTVVAVSDGDLVRSNGGYVRDDRERVRTLVNATAEWYGRVKRAVKFSYKQVRKLVEIGDLVTEVFGVGLPADINTPITSITYSMGDGRTPGKTSIETGFAEIDFQ